MSDDLGKKVHFKGPGQWRSQADAAQRATRPPAAALEEPPAQRSEPVEGLDWDPVEYLMRVGGGHFDEKLHPRKADGEFAPKSGGGAKPSAPAGWPRNAPKPQPADPHGDMSTAQLMNMIGDLRQEMEAERAKLRTDYGDQLHQVVEQVRGEEKKIATETAKAEKLSDLKAERRKAIVKSCSAILGLLAVGALIVATGGGAFEAGIAVGPLLGGELVTALHEAHALHQKKKHLAVRADLPAGAREQVVARMTRLVASMTGDEQAAPGLAEDLVSDAEDQLEDLGDAGADEGTEQQ